jgi:hypothetical protein
VVSRETGPRFHAAKHSQAVMFALCRGPAVPQSRSPKLNWLSSRRFPSIGMIRDLASPPVLELDGSSSGRVGCFSFSVGSTRECSIRGESKAGTLRYG